MPTANLLDLLFGFVINSKYGRNGCGFLPILFYYEVCVRGNKKCKIKIAWEYMDDQISRDKS